MCLGDRRVVGAGSLVQLTVLAWTNKMLTCVCVYVFFFFNDTATTEIYTLSLHDALPISVRQRPAFYTARFSLRQHPRFLYCPFLIAAAPRFLYCPFLVAATPPLFIRSEEHTSELQSLTNLVCRLLLEKKKKQNKKKQKQTHKTTEQNRTTDTHND